jgi:hypothetical protein
METSTASIRFLPSVLLLTLLIPVCDRNPTFPGFAEAPAKSIHYLSNFGYGDVRRSDGLILAVHYRMEGLYEPGPPVRLDAGRFRAGGYSDISSDTGHLDYVLPDPAVHATDPTWMEDGNNLRIAYQRHEADDGLSCIWLSGEGLNNAVRVYAGERTMGSLSSSADGRLFFLQPAGSSAGIYSLDPSHSSEPIKLANEDGWGEVSAAESAPVTDSVVYVALKSNGAEVYRIPSAGGRSERLTDFNDPALEISGAALSHCGYKLALCLKYVDSDSGHSLYILHLPTRDLSRVAISSPAEVANSDEGAMIRTPSFLKPCWFPDGESLLADCFNKIETVVSEGSMEVLSTTYRHELALVDIE